MNTQAPAGWYPQPDGTQRYWDGAAWTEHVEPATATVPVAVPAPGPVPEFAAVSTDTRPLWKKKRIIVPGAVVVGILAISAMTAAASDGTPEAEPTAAATAAPTTAATAEATADGTFVMPGLVGQNLQDAQDSLQALGSYFLDQTDASGDGRMQVDDDNWQVCTQEPAAGTEVPLDATVVLGSVKLDERCPGGGATAEEPAAEAPEDSDTSGLTNEQQEALEAAQNYLSYSAFSKKGLGDQLEFEGFSTADADAAIAVLVVDWNEQAANKAQEYLDVMAFSKSGLVGQLKFDGFTSKEAAAGVKAVGADWNEQAAKKAQEYLDVMSFSKSGLIDQLEFDGFTSKEAAYGAKAAGL